ncbi:hypothetical protein CFOL_v3_06796, partial [Cephalotus follicularis]
LYHEEDPD